MEEGKLQSNKVTLASSIQNLWFILFDRSSGRQIPLTVGLVRNSEDDTFAFALLTLNVFTTLRNSRRERNKIHSVETVR